MSTPSEMDVPDYVPDELVEMYGTARPSDPGARSQRPTVAAQPSGRAGSWRLGLALAGSLTAMVGILVALALAAPDPALTAVVLLALLVAAGSIGLVIARALLRAGLDTRPRPRRRR